MRSDSSFYTNTRQRKRHERIWNDHENKEAMTDEEERCSERYDGRRTEEGREREIKPLEGIAVENRVI